MNPRITLAHVMIVLLACLTAGIVLLPKFFTTIPLSTVGLGLLLFLSLMAFLFSTWYIKRARQNRFVGREALNSAALYEQYFQKSGLPPEVVIQLWQAAAQALKLPAELLRPTDRFDRELRPMAEWHIHDDHNEQLAAWAEGVAMKHGAKVDLMAVQTLGDLITLMARLEHPVHS
jgi:hypothetical protein